MPDSDIKLINLMADPKSRQRRYKQVFAWFEEHYGELTTELHYNSPFELLVAVMLSAQCTDARVNMVVPTLFAAFPTIDEMAQADEARIYELIRSISYPHAKAKHLLQTARQIRERFGGKVPDRLDDLLSLPGVGRKTANVVSAILWNKPTLGVDTHIFRVANRIGLTQNAKTPLASEQQLVQLIPASLIPKAHHWLIHHGRYVCTARQPHCDHCGIRTYCQHYLTMQP